MKLRVGDKVKFLNDTGGGIVSEIIDNKLVNVRIEEGFDVPVLASELVRDMDDSRLIEDHDFPSGSKKLPAPGIEDVEIKEDDINDGNLPEGALKNIYIGMVPEGESVVYNGNIDAYLINDSDFFIFYKIGSQEKDSFYYIKSGMLEANTKEHIKTFSQAALSRARKLHIQALFICRGRYFPQVPVDEYVNISSMSLYKESSYKENDFFDKRAVILTVVSDSTKNEKEKEEKSDFYQDTVGMDRKEDSIKAGTENKKTGKKQDKGKPVIEEVDLHIHAITDDYSAMSDGEILNMQMNRFYSVLDNASGSKNRKIVFIHGVGNGKLKYELRKALDTKYSHLEYQDASFKAYGFGATLVTIR